MFRLDHSTTVDTIHVKKMFVPSLVVLLLSLCEFGQSARILGVVPTPSYSHQVVFRPIWNELARKGHEVVVITTDPQNNPELNITEIDIHFLYDVWSTKLNVIKVINDYKYNIFKVYELMVNWTGVLTSEMLSDQNVQNLLKNETEHFDLVMVEYIFYPLIGFSWKYKCPHIGIVSLELRSDIHAMYGNPTHSVLYPDWMSLSSVDTKNFWYRLGNVALQAAGYISNELYSVERSPVIRTIMKEHFGQDVPPLLDIMKNASMFFINDNPTFNLRPVGPAFVLIGGGTHLVPPKELPKGLKQYLDGAKDGFIYFSLGTNVKSNVFLPEQRKIVLDAFRELPYKVLWKFDITDLPDVPNNVKISSWLPQHDILRHPNIKVFITQGGLQSIEETTFSHVPIVGIPYIADQDSNVKNFVAKGGGVFLDKDKLTKESVKAAILEVINNPKYKESVTELAELSMDHPMTGLQKAVWWTEYVIRHKGARHLRNPILDIPLYQYYYLDIIAFSLSVLLLVLFITYKLLVCIKNLVVGPAVKVYTKKSKSH